MRNPFRKPLETSVFHVSDYLDSDEMIAAFLSAALEENDPDVFQKALGGVAKAGGMASGAEHAGVGRESLYKSLSADGNPRFGTVIDVLDALGFRLVVTPGA